MRLLFVADFEPERSSGAAGTLLALAEALERAGHTVHHEWRAPGRAGGTLSRLLRLPGRQLEQVRRRLEAEDRHDAVIVSQPYAYRIYEDLAPQYPDTVFLNRTHGWEARLYEAHLRFRWDERSGLRRLGTHAMAALTERACRRTAAAAHGIITPSTVCRDFIRARHPAAADRVIAIPYGRDGDAPERPDPLGGRPACLLYVGNWLPLKGARLLEEILPVAAVRHADARLTLVVDDASRPLVDRRFRPAWGDRLTVHGWMARAELARVYAGHDMLLFPSLFEGFGKVWLEAMAAGLCVVGFAEGGLPDVAVDGREALLCPVGDVRGFSERLDRALGNLDAAREIGRRAQERVREFTWDRTARTTTDFLERMREAAGA